MLQMECLEGTTEILQVLCRNPSYGFELKKASKDAPYTVANLDREGGKTGRSIEFLGVGLFASMWLDDQTLEWSLKQPSFHVEDVELLEKNGRTVAEMSFSSEAFRRRDYQIRRGKIFFDPERSWAVLSYSIEVMLDGLAKVDAEVTYAPDGAHFPIPDLFVQDFRATVNERLIHRRDTVVISDVKACATPPDAFTLTAFGFPEPAQRKTSESDRRWYTMIGAAAVFFAVAVGLRMWANRRRATS